MQKILYKRKNIVTLHLSNRRTCACLGLTRTFDRMRGNVNEQES